MQQQQPALLRWSAPLAFFASIPTATGGLLVMPLPARALSRFFSPSPSPTSSPSQTRRNEPHPSDVILPMSVCEQFLPEAAGKKLLTNPKTFDDEMLAFGYQTPMTAWLDDARSSR